LTPAIRASGPHDFAVRDRAVRYRHFRVHRIPSRVRGDREPPLLLERDGRITPVICARKTKIFFRQDWTAEANHRRIERFFAARIEPTGRANARPMTDFLSKPL
jgi:hypothetical protein